LNRASVSLNEIEEIIKKLREFAAERDWDQFHSPKNLSMALAVEVAELMEHFQWLTEEQSRDLDPETLRRVREEIGDVQLYLARLADQLGISPLEAALEKIEINRRKYPADKARGKATKLT
jgi:dCTP diphosphatase